VLTGRAWAQVSPASAVNSARPAADRGASLVELLVVMILTGIIAPLSLALLASVWKSAGATIESAENVGNVRLGMQHLDRQIRSANAPLTVSSQSLSFTTCADESAPAAVGTVRRVEYQISAGVLQTRSYPADGTVGVWRTLVRGLAAGSGFTSTGARGVLVTLTGAAPSSAARSAVAESLLTARNPALPTPLPTVCP
jgi:type II secretory pathway pseudopilin PulG